MQSEEAWTDWQVAALESEREKESEGGQWEWVYGETKPTLMNEKG